MPRLSPETEEAVVDGVVVDDDVVSGFAVVVVVGVATVVAGGAWRFSRISGFDSCCGRPSTW
jgi:hypothetical protein